MKIYSQFSDINLSGNSVVTVGTFDGVHLGHEQILAALKDKALELNAESFVVTFEPHPRKIVSKNFDLKLLTLRDEKLEFFEKNGVDNVLVIEFTKEFSQKSSKEFIEEIICDKLSAKHIVIGYDHKFGKNRNGDVDLIREIVSKKNITVSTVRPVSIDGEVISSTKIRNYLNSANLDIANKFLGKHYLLRGNVIEGAKRGRILGFPTANILPLSSEKLVPANGVYIVSVKIDNSVYFGMMNIGFRPTFESELNLILEVNIFNFNQNIYGETITVEFLHYLRGEKKFSSKEKLIEQINKDKIQAEELVSHLVN